MYVCMYTKSLIVTSNVIVDPNKTSYFYSNNINFQCNSISANEDSRSIVEV